jgi:hypothetical protein
VTYKGREVSNSAEHRRNTRNNQFTFFKVKKKLLPQFHTPKVYGDTLALNATKHNYVLQIKHRYVPLARMKW